MIKRYLFLLISLVSVAVYGQSARDVLDSAARKLTQGGTYANFSVVTGGERIWGNIAIKGNMFKITSANAITWFDGKTQWTYMRGTDEVSIAAPDIDQQQQINPYHFINLYKNGYSARLSKNGSTYSVTLKNKNGGGDISDAVIVINRTTYYPSLIRVKSGGEWTEFRITGAKRVNYNSSHFRFPEKDYKDAEIIDLR